MTAAAAMPMALLIVAVGALAGWWMGRSDAPPRKITFVFPENAPMAAAVVDLVSCTTIEEAMLFKVMGVVRNLSAVPLCYTTASVSFLDDQGNKLDGGEGCVVPEVLAPQFSGRFVLVTRPDPRIVRVAVTLIDANGAALPADYSLKNPALGFVHH